MSVTTDVGGASRAVTAVASDGDLLTAVRDGDEHAYGELFGRHADAARRFARSLGASAHEADDLVSEAFTKVLAAVRGGSGPEDAFRPYLLTAVRRLSWRQGERRDDPTEDEDLGRMLGPAALGADDPDAAIALDAFLSLPERWQTVLWHTEIEGATPAEVAPIVGLTPHAVAALASRAREGLRQAFLQQHLRAEPAAGCRFTVEHLGSHVRDAVSARDRAKIDEHLDDCGRCRRLRSELTDVNSALRGMVAPAILGVGARQYLAGGGGGSGAATSTAGGSSRGGRVLAAASAAGVLLLGGLGVSRALETDDSAAPVAPSSAAAADGLVQGTPAAATDEGTEGVELPGPVNVTPTSDAECASGVTGLPTALTTATDGASVSHAVLFRGDIAGLPSVAALADQAGTVVRPVTSGGLTALRDFSAATGVSPETTASCLTAPVASLLEGTGAWRLLVGYSASTLDGVQFVVVDRVLPALDGVRAQLSIATDEVVAALSGLEALAPTAPTASSPAGGAAADQPAAGTGTPDPSGSTGGGAALPLPDTGGDTGGDTLGLDDLLGDTVDDVVSGLGL